MKSVLLIGLGRFGKSMAIELNALGHEVMGVDIQESCVNDAMDILTNAQIGDSTNIEFLRSLGVDNYDLCVVSISNQFQSSLETTCYLKELGAHFVLARAESEVEKKFLLRNGADEVIFPEEQVARWAAIRYSSDHILDYIELDETHAIFEVDIPKNWIGKSIGQLDIRSRFGITIVAVKVGDKMRVSVTPDTILSTEQTMLVLGEYKALQKCFRI